MKYVVDIPQNVIANGKDHQGNIHNNSNVQLNGLLTFEHTDGLNYINVNYNYQYPLYEDSTHQHAISVFLGAGAGILMPRSNVELIGHSNRKDEFKLAGYGLDVQGGIIFDFFTNYFLRGEVKGGYINMPNVSTSTASEDKASHSFNFVEYSLSFGYKFSID